MKFYSAFEWLLIDVATQYGLDKKTFEERIDWTKANFDSLESFYSKEWKEKPMYVKAVMALRDVCAGKPTGHMVGVDASASGIQLMSALTGCAIGCESTGLINPDVRADIYTKATVVMNEILHKQGLSVNVPRDDIKKALMTSYYASTAMPKNLFGEDTPELAAFYEAAKRVAPGAWELLQDIKGLWTPAKKHSWVVPDGFHVHVKVMVTKETRIEVDELDHATFTYQYKENEGTAKGRSLVANITHSLDGMVVREMHRMVNYNPIEIQNAIKELTNPSKQCDPKWIELFNKTGFATFREIVSIGAIGMSDAHRKALLKKCVQVLQWKPYPLVTVHDDFKTLPGGVNAVRFHYMSVLAEISEGTILDFILSTHTGQDIKYHKLGNVGTSIRESNYAIC